MFTPEAQEKPLLPGACSSLRVLLRGVTFLPMNSLVFAVVLEKTLESPLDGKEIQPVHPKGDACQAPLSMGISRQGYL